MKKRILYYDNIRYIAALFVVNTHFILRNNETLARWCSNRNLVKVFQVLKME